MERRRSLKDTKGHPLFNQRMFQPPIHQKNLNSSGESSGGSSSEWVESSHSSLEVSETPYTHILHAMEQDPKWRSERGTGRAIGMYRIYGEIGSGNFARVRLGVHQLIKEKVAVKIIEKSRLEGKLEKMLGREVATLDALQHSNILRLYEVIETPWKLYLISEWAPAGDLYAKVTLRGRLNEKDSRSIFTQILSALTFIHANGVVHRDLKAENIFFTTGSHCKVGDFGFATLCQKDQLLSTFCGSPPYAAPELFRDDNYQGGPVDIWALGILLYFMLEGTLPFQGNSIPSLKAAILLGQYELSPQLSNECSHLLTGILQQHPRHRLNLSQIVRHPWLRGGGMRRQDTTALLQPATVNRALSTELPTPHQLKHRLLSTHEVQALSILNRLGISNSELELHRVEGVRNSVGGIYRILLHKLQQGQVVNQAIFDLPPPSATSSTTSVPQPPPIIPEGLPVPGSSKKKSELFQGGLSASSTTCAIF